MHEMPKVISQPQQGMHSAKQLSAYIPSGSVRLTSVHPASVCLTGLLVMHTHT